MAYRPDPGGIFASDTHRRVLGHLPLPGDDPSDVTALGYRISGDAHHGLAHVDELSEVLEDLEADGHATQLKDGWRLTKGGLDALNADVPDQPDGPTTPAVLGGLEERSG